MLKRIAVFSVAVAAMLAFLCPADAERRSKEAIGFFHVDEGSGFSVQGLMYAVDMNRTRADEMIASKPKGGFISALTIDPVQTSTLYAGTQQGVLKTTDSGDSWVAVNHGLTSRDVLALTIDPLKTSTLYAGTKKGAFKSTNGGGRWYPMEKGLPHTPVLAIAVDPARTGTVYLIARDPAFVFGVFAEEDRRGEVVSGSRDCPFKSTNSGARWSSCPAK